MRVSVRSLAVLVFLVTSPADAADICSGVTPMTSAQLAAPGPYPVGVRTFVFVDPSRPTAPNGSYAGAPDRTLTTEVWYPAAAAGRDTAIDLSGAPYPVVVHSHGFLDSRVGERYVAEQLASRGYVVAAPDYPLSNGGAPGGPTIADVPNQPGDWSFVLDRVLAELGAAVDPARVGASGLSLGGLTTLLVTYHRDLRDPRIGAALPMAAPGCMFTRTFFQTTTAPLLLLHGDSDLIVPLRDNGRRDYRFALRPKQLVTLRNGSHTGFSAFATAFDQSLHFDAIGCNALSGGFLPEENPLGALGGLEVGVDPTPERCGPPCQQPVPDGPSMGAARHHELTRIVATAFFDGVFRDDVTARCYLRRWLRRENPDVRIRTRPAVP